MKAANTGSPKQRRALPKVLSREEVNRLIASATAKDGASGLRLGCMVELLYASGLRISELLALPAAADIAIPRVSDICWNVV